MITKSSKIMIVFNIYQRPDLTWKSLKLWDLLYYNIHILHIWTFPMNHSIYINDIYVNFILVNQFSYIFSGLLTVIYAMWMLIVTNNNNLVLQIAMNQYIINTYEKSKEHKSNIIYLMLYHVKNV